MTGKKTIELNKSIDAPAKVIFDAIKEGQLLKSTGIKPETFKHDFRVGGQFSLQWTSPTAGSCTGRYLQIEPNKKLQFVWNSLGCKSSTNGDTVVTVTLKETGQSTELKLVHEGLDAGFCYDDHLAGWTSSISDFDREIKRLVLLSEATLAFD